MTDNTKQLGELVQPLKEQEDRDLESPPLMIWYEPVFPDGRCIHGAKMGYCPHGCGCW